MCRSRASSASSAGGPSPGTRTSASCRASPAASACSRRASAGASRNTTCRPSSRRATVPVGQPARAGMLRLDAEMRGVDRQDAGHLAAHAVGRIGRAQQRQHRVLHPAGEARGRAPGRQQPIGALALDPQHRRHVIGHALAMQPRRRLQHADTARDARPARPGWRAGTPRRTRASASPSAASPWAGSCARFRRSAGRSWPSRRGTPRGPCRSADG